MILPSKKLAAIASIVGGLVYFSQHYTIDGLHGLRIEPKSQTPAQANNAAYSHAKPIQWPTWNQEKPGTPQSPQPSGSNWVPSGMSQPITTFTSSPNMAPASALATPAPLRAPALKIASFNLQRFGHHKVENPFVIETVIKIIKQFDIIALQEICTQQQDLIALVVDRVNQSGGRYDYLIGPRVGRGESLEQFAFVFNTLSIETDREQLYTVDDHDNLFLSDPLVGWFRAKQLDPQSAFTFTLVNVHCDPEHADSEIRLLPELVRSVHRDGRNEDDVIVAGDFGADSLSFNYLQQRGFTVALSGTPTLVNGSRMVDNILLASKATDEFIGRAGTLDFLRKSNLSIDQAIQVSDHLPIWAEFSIVEGGAYKN